ncbi:MAG: Smr/MutS family protein, partial [Chloroflexota bacterium]|nr:Smr/MutS family protein [Chloroflexota bacterium]
DRVEADVSEPVERQVTEIPRPRYTGPVVEGGRVYVQSLGQKGIVKSINGDEIEVQVGVLRLRTKIAELEPISGGAPAPKKEKKQTVIRTSVSSPGTELDLRGQRVDEALLNLEHYLDRAYMAKLPWVRIIHGKGTGRLCTAVREALQNYSYIKEFESGKRVEGGDGVTVASFKE